MTGKGKTILFKNDQIYNNLSPKGKLAYLKEIQKGNQVDPDEFNNIEQAYVEPEGTYDLGKTMIQLTNDKKNEEKVLAYIDKQNNPKPIPEVVQDLRRVLDTNITDDEGRWILSCVIGYSDEYHQKAIQLIAS
ncbi:hypothetical protein FOL01_0923 [Weissella jogaejeotgali]|uniref:Uncharacterized protein n=1 Tax=Weissella jogaejeotgali TaxID=1631871 RepID=A0A1L6RBC7_9LACO|nr:hypothetical protein [Weissella jogaejeotgali]APS41782.1 hypothetical protein FOL01_0923 [Weissella jogaejeotgali]